ncbi:hypothetical protein GYH30_016350 [Glycine max]|uniref:Acetyl-CoA carboxylase central domain-containing protein n=1 Tax=Glycine max TaxID=3847 RepID=A0A0R0JLK2_SOYBN|nr:hypothetical protein GYH30_016350 [Glycine max]
MEKELRVWMEVESRLDGSSGGGAMGNRESKEEAAGTRLLIDGRTCLLQLESKYKEFEGISSSQIVDFPAKLLKGIVETHLSSCPDKEKGAQERLAEPLLSLVKSYEGGRESHAHIIVKTYNNL